MKGTKGLYFGANNAVLDPVSFVHRRRRRRENSRLYMHSTDHVT